MFDHDALLEALKDQADEFHRIGGDSFTILNESTNILSIDDWDKAMTTFANNAAGYNKQDVYGSGKTRTATIAPRSTPILVDEIPPFDITISMANEYGHAAVMVLYGVEILNSGSQFSIDQIMSQQACTFAARRLKTLTALDKTGNEKKSSTSTTSTTPQRGQATRTS